MKLTATVVDDRVIIEVDAAYIENAYFMGVTTNTTGTITDRQEMLNDFALCVKDTSDDSPFGRFVDAVCENAIDSGASFVEADEI